LLNVPPEDSDDSADEEDARAGMARRSESRLKTGDSRSDPFIVTPEKSIASRPAELPGHHQARVDAFISSRPVFRDGGPVFRDGCLVFRDEDGLRSL